MPYNSPSKLPENVQRVLPPKAQRIYMEAYNNAHEQYQDKSTRRGDESLEQTAAKVAWSAVKKEYRKGADGKWHPK